MSNRKELRQTALRDGLPRHLQQFVADQAYETQYSAIDQCVWRYVLRHLNRQLKTSAHPVYFEGLEKTGISTTHIPSIEEMNQCLASIGWRAIAVEGFIPPQAFMEFQSLRVLPIALEIRQPDHIDYTPAPDIIHEAAGHAPILVDEEYSEYLQRFGEVGMRAMYNQYDLDLYQAVFELSNLKESPTSTPAEIKKADSHLTALTSNPGIPSELARLTTLHWWTVEYGLVGELDNYKLFGAGLLSSLSESVSCLDDKQVKKLPFTVDALQTSYDITEAQPQLFVTKSCRHLTQILDQFATTMCYQVGGAASLQQAIDAGVVTTAEYSSGLQVSGKLNRLLCNSLGDAIYIGTGGPTQLSVDGRELAGHGTDYHASGFGSPVGKISNLTTPPEQATEAELVAMNIKRETKTRIEFLSGVTVTGYLKSITKVNSQNVLFTFHDCLVLGPTGEVLFDPSWGVYDMAVGESINSVFAGSADPERFDVYPVRPGSAQNRTNKVEDRANATYETLLALIESADNEEALHQLAREVLTGFPDEWLIQLELLRLLHRDTESHQQLCNNLRQLQQRNPDLRDLIQRDLIL